MQQLQYLTIITVAAPLLGAIVTGLGLRYCSKRFTHWFTIGLMVIAFICSSAILYGYVLGSYKVYDFDLYTWATIGNMPITVGFLLDRLSATMITVVTFVSLMVHIYSIGYMSDDPGYKRFFSYISLFTFAMLMLVLANNFMQLFFGWEGVGLVSYLLIGFWFKRSSAIFAGLKAFIVNRIGDFGFVLGIAAVLYYFNNLHYSTVFAQITATTETTLICACLFVGAMAKSAQIPLHVWLPDSMEGPTPISALIHAATMVTAGVYMVARMSPLFEQSEQVLQFITIIGALGCLFMGMLGVVQHDIKRIIAYSTLSQLGYMMVAMGVSAYAAGIFHLVTHAFFKALLFLGAGSAIIAMHHNQDIFNMGNLRKYMPITFATMLIGSLALCGFPGTAGFFSKDMIIEATRFSSLPIAPVAYFLTLISVFVTALYTFRMLFLVFFTQERMSAEIKEHLHESSKVVWIPLVCLAIPSLIIGAFMVNAILGNFFVDSIDVLPKHDVLALVREYKHDAAWMIFLHGFIELPFVFLVLGFITAWLCYIRFPRTPQILANHASGLVRILHHKYYFDYINEQLIVPLVRMTGKVLWQSGDVKFIDGYMVNGSAYAVGNIARRMRTMQTGYLYHYVLTMILGMLVLLLFLFY